MHIKNISKYFMIKFSDNIFCVIHKNKDEI